MRYPVLFSLAVMFFLASAFTGVAMQRVVRGQLVVNPRLPARELPAGLHLLLKINGRLLQDLRPDSAGYFSLDLPAAADSVTDLFCLAPGLDTLFLQSLPGGAIDSGTHRLLFPCQPDTTASGDIICPKCRQDDQVYPMVYGDPIVITRHFDTTGKVTYQKSPKKPVQPDTLIRAARYYCRRDRITF